MTDLFLEQASASGHALIMVTHDSEIAAAADRVVKLDHGRVSDREMGGGATPVLSELG